MKLRQFTLQTAFGNSFNFTVPFAVTGKEEVLAAYSRATGGREAFAKRVAENGANVRLFTAQGLELEGAKTLHEIWAGGPPCASPKLFMRVAFYGGGGGTKRVAAESGPKQKKQAKLFAFQFSNAQVSEGGPY